jgi:hypothetical protein
MKILMHKFSAFLLVLSLLIESAVQAYSFHFPPTQAELSVYFQTEAINPAPVWVHLSNFPWLIRRTWSLLKREKAQEPSLPHTFLSDSITRLGGDFLTFQQLTTSDIADPTKSPETFRKLGVIEGHQYSLMEGIGQRARGTGTSLYSLLETAEDQLLSGQSVDLAMISFPLLDAKNLSKITGDPNTADRLKDSLCAAIERAGYRTATSGGRIIVMGIPAKKLGETIYSIIDLFITQNTAKETDLKSSPKGLKKKNAAKIAAYEKALRDLKFYASHVNLYLERAPKQISGINAALPTLEERIRDLQITPAAYRRLPLNQRKSYVDELDALRRHQRSLWSQSVAYWLSQKRKSENYRLFASQSAESLLVDAFARLSERVEVIEKTEPPLRDVLNQAAAIVRRKNGDSEYLPILDDKTVEETKELLSTRPDDPEDRRWLFYEAIYQGRLKAIPLLNYDTTQLPRLNHLVPTKQFEKLRIAVLQLRDKPTTRRLRQVKIDSLVLYARMLQALVYIYRSPRFIRNYRLDLINEVGEAYRDGSMSELFSQINALIANPTLQRVKPQEIKRLKALLPLYNPTTFIFKRDVGDETGVAKWEQDKGVFQMAMIELNKYNARQQEYTPDSIDSLQHRLQQSLMNVLVSFQDQGNNNLAEALTWWQAEISKLAPEKFQVTDKVPKESGLVRLPVFRLRNRRFWEPKKVVFASEGEYYVSRGADWGHVKLSLSKIARLIPIKSTLSAAILVAENRYLPEELNLAFAELSENETPRQKKMPWLTEIVATLTKHHRLIPSLNPARRQIILAAA